MTDNAERTLKQAEEPTAKCSRAVDNFYAIIPAGGIGTRLWPLSRESNPKFLHAFGESHESLLQQTFQRLQNVCKPSHINVATGIRYANKVLEQLHDLGCAENAIFGEPVPRDSAAAIALATAVLVQRHGEHIIVGSFAADHAIDDVELFTRTIHRAADAAQAGYIATIGISITEPSTAFGYIQAGDKLSIISGRDNRESWGSQDNSDSYNDPNDSRDSDDSNILVYSVQRFVEKPDKQTAKAYESTGDYRWNAGMFVMRADVLLKAFRRIQPKMYSSIIAIARDWDTPARDETLMRLWPSIEKVAFDYAIAEPMAADGLVAMVPGNFGWNDIGDFAALSNIVEQASVQQNSQSDKQLSVQSENIITLKSENISVFTDCNNREKIIAVVGVNNVAVVETDDAVLVLNKGNAQDVKSVVNTLHQRGLDSVL